MLEQATEWICYFGRNSKNKKQILEYTKITRKPAKLVTANGFRFGDFSFPLFFIILTNNLKTTDNQWLHCERENPFKS